MRGSRRQSYPADDGRRTDPASAAGSVINRRRFVLT
jgi:hypothetical protein